MKKKRIQPSTCLMMGLIGAVFSAIAGALMLGGFGEATLPRAVAFVMEGAMLLFLALANAGGQHRKTRAGLLGLFFMLLVSYFNLPLLCPALEMLVIPLLGFMRRQPGDGLCLAVLSLAELWYALCRTLVLAGLFGGAGLFAVGISLVLVSAARFWLLFRLHRRAGEAL